MQEQEQEQEQQGCSSKQPAEDQQTSRHGGVGSTVRVGKLQRRREERDQQQAGAAGRTRTSGGLSLSRIHCGENEREKDPTTGMATTLVHRSAGSSVTARWNGLERSFNLS